MAEFDGTVNVFHLYFSNFYFYLYAGRSSRHETPISQIFISTYMLVDHLDMKLPFNNNKIMGCHSSNARLYSYGTVHLCKTDRKTIYLLSSVFVSSDVWVNILI